MVQNKTYRKQCITKFSQVQDSISIQMPHIEASPKLMKDILTDSYHIFELQEPYGINIKALSSQVLSTHATARFNNKPGILKIEVVDTGCGISEEFSVQMWDAFRQNDTLINRKTGGMGLGLHIVKELTKLMKGEVKCYSTKDIGSNFMCVLPVPVLEIGKAQYNSDITHLSSSETVIEWQPNVLIVEDQISNQFVLKSYFEKLGINPTLASNGQEGYDIYISRKEGFFSFMTLDLQMPEVDGITCAKMIRKYETDNKIESPIPIVVVTGNISEEEKAECLDPTGFIRATCFYQKPFRYQDCKSFVEIIVNGKMTRGTSCQ